MKHSEFLEVFVLAERLHRQFLEAIQLELDTLNIRDINNVRALMLLNIGDAEMTVSELLWRGCYLGSNVSYNLKKLTEAGYVVQERSSHDRRVIMVRSSERGAELCALLQEMNNRHVKALTKGNFKMEDLITCRQVLRTLQRFWSREGQGDAGAGSYDGLPSSAPDPLPSPLRPSEPAFSGASTRAA
jgi:DNA-binding MarR family transcriptional regulator